MTDSNYYDMKKDDRIIAYRDAIESMCHGKFVSDIPTGDDEIGYLGKSLRDLSALLKKQLDKNQLLYQVMIESKLYKLIKVNRQLVEQKKKLEQRVTHDSLTGLLNRSAIFDIFHKQIARARRNGSGIAIIMIDIDHFKHINDTCGHLTGDAVLCEIANRLTQSARSHEYIGRFGGEEFLAILSLHDQDGALKVAERLCNAVASLPVRAGQSLIPVTISLGVAVSTEHTTLDENLLLRKADEALYLAKHRGRNRVEINN
ncbi:MAG: GGDEF domain-containing protein [Pseudomonadota bacterium]